MRLATTGSDDSLRMSCRWCTSSKKAIDSELVGALKAAFAVYDRDGDGAIVHSEQQMISNSVAEYRPSFSDPNAEEVYAKLQCVGITAEAAEGGVPGGKTSQEEFLTTGQRDFDEEAAQTISSVTATLQTILDLDAELTAVFNIIDTDNSSTISADENVEAAKHLSAEFGENEEQASRERFKGIDANDDGQVSYCSTTPRAGICLPTTFLHITTTISPYKRRRRGTAMRGSRKNGSLTLPVLLLAVRSRLRSSASTLSALCFGTRSKSHPLGHHAPQLSTTTTY